jgi:GGDEF domain-containing protein
LRASTWSNRLVRPLDRVYRWGGDEFLLLFPAVLPEEVVPRVREALPAVPELEASVGAARFSGTENLPAAIERADQAMYEEKARNRAARAGAGGGAARSMIDGSSKEHAAVQASER